MRFEQWLARVRLQEIGFKREQDFMHKIEEVKDDGEQREFWSGATRNTVVDKTDYEGHLSVLVLRRYCEYMHKNRVRPDGTMRDSDNWQLGIPQEEYMKSMWRHFMDVWFNHRSGTAKPQWEQETLCALLFNVQGMLHEILKKDK